MKTASEVFPEYAKDIKINFTNVLTPEGSPGLSAAQIYGAALASAYAAQSAEAVKAVRNLPGFELSPEHEKAVRAAAAIMAMNNVYYRFLHLVNDADYRALPAKLRMTVIGNPGIDKADFEVYSLAVSAINGCGGCVESHSKKLTDGGMPKEAVQSSARIASVVRAAAQVFSIQKIDGE